MKNRYGFGDNSPGNNTVLNLAASDLRSMVKSKNLRVLSNEEFNFWQYNGFIVVKNAISKKDVSATADLLWEFQ